MPRSIAEPTHFDHTVYSCRRSELVRPRLEMGASPRVSRPGISGGFSSGELVVSVGEPCAGRAAQFVSVVEAGVVWVAVMMSAMDRTWRKRWPTRAPPLILTPAAATSIRVCSSPARLTDAVHRRHSA